MDDLPPKTLADNLRRVQEHLRYVVAENERLRSFLLEYGRHQEGCNAQWGEKYRCRCGWDAVIGSLVTVGVTPASGSH